MANQLFEIIQLNQMLGCCQCHGTALAWLMADQLHVGA
jgi:hypothetical protein